MNLAARLSRLEQKHVTGDPFAELTDEELEAAIEAINQSLAEALGATPEKFVEYADIPVNISEQNLRALVASIKGGWHG